MSAVHKEVNLFLVGAMKAGTTSLVSYLSQHPDIYVPPIKEPNFFTKVLPTSLYEPSRFFDLESYFEKDFPNPLHITKISTASQYKRVYSLVNKQNYTLDASTAYLHAPGTPERIHAYNPKAKIIIMIRDPLDRLLSHYRMDLGLGKHSTSINEILQQEIKDYDNGTLAWYSYLGMSLYHDSIKNYKRLFTDNVLVLKFDELRSNPEETLKSLFVFLGIDQLDDLNSNHNNKTRKLRFQYLFYILKKAGMKDYFSKVLSPNARQKIFKVVSTPVKDIIDINPDIAAHLDSIFKKESLI